MKSGQESFASHVAEREGNRKELGAEETEGAAEASGRGVAKGEDAETVWRTGMGLKKETVEKLDDAKQKISRRTVSNGAQTEILAKIVSILGGGWAAVSVFTGVTIKIVGDIAKTTR